MQKDVHGMTYLGGIAFHPDFHAHQVNGKLGKPLANALRAEAAKAHAENVDPNELHRRLVAVTHHFKPPTPSA